MLWLLYYFIYPNLLTKMNILTPFVVLCILVSVLWGTDTQNEEL